MFAFVHASEGLLIAHLGLTASFLVGSSLFPWCDRERALTLSSSELMMRIVGTCGLGIAAFGFAAFVLAIFGVFKPYIYYPLVAVLAFASAAAHGVSPFAGRFWYSRLAVFARSWGPSSFILYLLLVVLAFPAIVGNMGGSDPVGYHLVYAAEWAKSGHLTIDPFLRLPFYASNVVLLYAALMSLGGAAFVNFLSWAAALLTALGVVASVESVFGDDVARPYAALIAVALTVSVVISPMYLRWMDTAYIDTAIGAFALMSLLCFLIGVRERNAAWLAVAAVLGGFLIGTKGSFFVLMPVYILIIAISAHRLDLKGRSALGLMALLLICASPWYVRNIILAGDPAPPAFNVAIYGRDGFMTKGEWKQDESDLSTPKAPTAIAALPVNAFMFPQSRYFREYGTTALMLVLYLPMTVLLLLFARGRPIDAGLNVAAVFVSLLAGYWMLSSSLLRYASLFYPSLAVALALSAAALPLKGRKFLQALIVAAAALLMLPSPGSREFFREYAMSRFRYLPGSYLSDDYYLTRFSPGYAEVQLVARFIRGHHLGPRLYTLGMRSQYDFERQGITAIGDWMGVGGYYRLYRAVDARQAVPYLRMLRIRAIVIAPGGAISAMNVPLEEQLTKGGFCRIAIPGSGDYRFYVSSRNVCDANAAL